MSNQTNAFLYQGNTVVVFLDGEPHTLSAGHINFTHVVEILKEDPIDWDYIREIIDPTKALETYGEGNVTIEGDQFTYKGKPLNNVLTRQIVNMFREGFNIAPFVAFMDNLNSNPSRTAVNELYEFLEAGKLPITPDGHFLAYKKVRDDYTDGYTGKIDNSIGQVVEMERNEVDDVRDRHCSYGLHFCSQQYLDNSIGGNRLMVVKINPRDVVSIPSDYGFSKGRTCRYEVVDEIDRDTDEVNDAFTHSVQETANYTIGADGRARDSKGRFCKVT